MAASALEIIDTPSHVPLTQTYVISISEELQGGAEKRGKFEVDYEILPHGQVPSAHAIRTWVRNFEETGWDLKKKA
jgi:hypothetical protein